MTGRGYRKQTSGVDEDEACRNTSQDQKQTNPGEPPYQTNRTGAREEYEGDINLKQMVAYIPIRSEIENQIILTGRRRDIDEINSECSQGWSKVVSKGDKTAAKLCTNLYKFALSSNERFYKYDVTFTPRARSARLERRLIKNLEEVIGLESKYVTDGSNIFTAKPLNKDLLGNKTVSLHKKIYTANVSLVQGEQPNSGQILQILNSIFGSTLQNIHGWKWSYGYYYNFTNMIPIEGTSMSAFPGFSTPILNYENGTHLLLNMSHQIVTNQNAWVACDRIPMKVKDLIGKIVCTCYNGRTYKVEEVDTQTNIDCQFKYKGKKMTIRNYYKNKYGLTLHDITQPLLAVKSKWWKQRASQMIYLVPELCLVTGLDKKDRFNSKFMDKLHEVTKPIANDRIRKMNEFMENYKSDASTVLKAFNIEVSKDMMSVTAKKLPDVTNIPKFTDVKIKPFLDSKRLNKWLIVYPSHQDISELDGFMDLTTSCMRKMGMHVNPPEKKTYNDMDDMQHALKSCQDDTDMVVVIIKDRYKEEDYSRVKKTLCVENPIPSQVITSKVLKDKCLHLVCSNMALQINSKLGGAGWKIDMNTRNKMIVGVDVYHDHKTGASVMGVVASMDDLCTKYHTTWAIQDSGRGNNFKDLFTECLRAYQMANNFPCMRIVIYRARVGDGQLAQLGNAEVKEAQKAITDIGWNETKLFYVVVKKRVALRFFHDVWWKYEGAGKGHVIDSGATKPNCKEFFLITQETKDKNRALSPTHFNVFANTTDLSMYDIQLLTYQSCFMYFNLNDSIRVPATCQYAHKIAFLIGEVICETPSDKLKDKLFYL